MDSFVLLLVLGTMAAVSPRSVPVKPFPLQNGVYSYYDSNNKVTYMDAEKFCNARGGQLVVIDSDATYNYVKALVAKSDRAWIGLNDQATEGKFVWNKGQTNGFNFKAKWSRHEPNNLHNEDCTEMYTNGLLNDLRCNHHRRKFICQKDTRCLVNGKRYANKAKIPQKDSCKTCTCSDGKQQCVTKACAAVKLRSWCKLVKQKGACCPEPVCAPFPLQNGGYSYYVSSNVALHKNAEKDCNDRGGHLVSIGDEAKNEFVKKQARGVRIWIGNNDRKTEDAFASSNGHLIKFTKWAGGEPNNLNNEDCIEMYPDGRWNDLRCDRHSRKYICQKACSAICPKNLKPVCGSDETTYNNECLLKFAACKQEKTITVASQGKCKKDQEGQEGGGNGEEPGAGNACPAGYEKFKTTCYKVYKDKKSYADAVKTCKNEKAHLLRIKDDEGAKYFAEECKKTKGFCWIGLNDIKKEGKFIWENAKKGKKTKYNKNFAANQPDDWKVQNKKDGEDCVHLYSSGTPKWNDLDCNQKHGFICGTEQTKQKKDRCGSKFDLDFEGKCYYVGTTPKNFNDAQADCKKNGGRLANIRSPKENDFVKNQAKNFKLWIGLHFQNVKKEKFMRWWIGVNGKSFKNWQTGEPNNCCGGEDCTEMYKSGAWNDNGCTKSRKYICEKEKVKGKCPAKFGITAKNRDCYMIGESVKKYNDAREDCKKNGGYLTTIQTKAENDFIRGKVRSKTGNDNTWIGLTDQDKPNRKMDKLFYWVNNYENWNAGEPNDKYNEDCTEMYSSGKWNDQQCTDKLKYICKKW